MIVIMMIVVIAVIVVAVIFVRRGQQRKAMRRMRGRHMPPHMHPGVEKTAWAQGKTSQSEYSFYNFWYED